MLIPYAGLLVSLCVCYLLLHYWLIDLVVRVTELPFDEVHDLLMDLLVLFAIVRTLLIWIGRDPVTAMVEGAHKHGDQEL